MPRPAPFFFDWGGIHIPKSSNVSDLQAMKPDEGKPPGGMGQTPQAGQGRPPVYTPSNPRTGPMPAGEGRWQGPTPYDPRAGGTPQQPGPGYGFARPPEQNLPFQPQPQPGGGMGGGTDRIHDFAAEEAASKASKINSMPDGWLKLIARAFI